MSDGPGRCVVTNSASPFYRQRGWIVDDYHWRSYAIVFDDSPTGIPIHISRQDVCVFTSLEAEMAGDAETDEEREEST